MAALDHARIRQAYQSLNQIRGASPLGLPHAVARGGPVPRSAPAGAPVARQSVMRLAPNQYKFSLRAA